MQKNMTKPIAVLGSGSWGTALAQHLANNGQKVYLWGRDKQLLEKMRITRCNDRYLPEIQLSDNLFPVANLLEVMAEANDLLVAVPSHAFRATLLAIKAENSSPSLRIISASKGIDPLSHQLLHEVTREILGEVAMAVLAGPTFAKEVAIGLPTAVSIATKDENFAEDLITRFHSRSFRVYKNKDIVGVEVGGAIKNVLAIAVGIADGLRLGANARSALITRGLNEMTRFGVALGGRQETFVGLSGLGDLVLTCTDNQSRNRRFGLALGSGKSIEQVLSEIGQVVEGFRNAAEIFFLKEQKNIELPICDHVYEVLYKNLSPILAVERLLSRSIKSE